jgi:hypothetical protein
MKRSRTYLPLILLLAVIWAAILAWGNAAMQARHIDQLSRLDNQYKSELRDLQTFQQSAGAALHNRYNEQINQNKQARLRTVYEDICNERIVLKSYSVVSVLLFVVIATCIVVGLLGLYVIAFRCYREQSNGYANWQTF